MEYLAFIARAIISTAIVSTCLIMMGFFGGIAVGLLGEIWK